MALHVGDRRRKRGKRLWAKIPRAYRQHAMFYTEQYVVSEGVMPAAQHRAISKLVRKTNHIERFNNTWRQRVSRLGRDALSFSRKLAHHIGAIKRCICHDNLTRAAASREHDMECTTPAAALTALFDVLFLEAKAGRIEFEAWQFKIRGASGEVVLFVVVFLAIATAVKL
jgi:IS1 family transposase